MANLVKTVQLLPRWRLHFSRSASSLSFSSSSTTTRPISFAFSSRRVHSRSLLSHSLSPPENDSFDTKLKKSRNELKREARRAVRWGMQLVSFSPHQIKRILRVVSLEDEVFDALMLVKRLGPDVREGKRRQFNYIGKLMRGVEPELMDSLIQASKDGDQNKFQLLSSSEAWSTEGDTEELDDEDEEDSQYSADMVTRWFNGLTNNNTNITREIYSLHGVDFDRQELRRLVREVISVQGHEVSSEEDRGSGTAVVSAERRLIQYLSKLARQLSSD